MKEVVAIFQMISLLLQMVQSLGYQQIETKIYNYNQKIYVLEADTKSGADVSSMLAGESVFGFAHLNVMAKEKNALATVNGMFFDDLGSPAGLLCEAGEWIRISDIGTPSLVIADGEATIQDIQVTASWQSKEKNGPIYAYNNGAYHGIANVFTAFYGLSNRVFRPQVTYHIVGNKVKKREMSEVPISIGEGYLLTYLLPEGGKLADYHWENLPNGIPHYQVGDTVEIKVEARDENGSIIQPNCVYQTGGWLVKEGQSRASDYEEFIGYTTSLQPRTAVAINSQGKLCFLVVDGRQKGIAEGLTGKWLADFLAEKKMKSAAYLDGGASSMLYLGGRLINQPAFPDVLNGKEIAHAILIKRKLME